MTETTTRRYVSCAETAKYVRAALKAAFPGVKFSVRSNTYSGGASIDVSWVDGPSVREFDKVGKLYQGATFDGMIDLKSHHDTVLAGPDGAVEVVHFGADWVMGSREFSLDYEAVLAAWVIHILERSSEHDAETFTFDRYGNGPFYRDVPTPFGVFDGTSGQLMRLLSQHVAPSGVPYNDRIEAY